MHVDMCVNVFEQFTWRVNQQENEAALTCPLGRSLSSDSCLLGRVCVCARVRFYVCVCVQKRRCSGFRGRQEVKSLKVQVFRNVEQNYVCVS